MSKLLILTRFVKEYEPTRLAEEARKAGLEVEMKKYGQVTLGITEGISKFQFSSFKQIDNYQYVIPRAASKKGSSMVDVKDILLRQLQKNGAKILNSESFIKYPLLGKIEQGIMLAEEGLPTVDFVTFGSKLGWREFRQNADLAMPLIIKGRFGSHGRKVKLVKDWNEFDEVFGRYKEGMVLVQPKLKVKQWYRCIVVGGKYLGEMRHRQKEKYGGEQGKLVKLNSLKMKRLEEICLRAAKLFDCDYCGIDVVWDEDKQEFAILEVNRTAQFKYFEKRTGVNVAGAIVDFLSRN